MLPIGEQTIFAHFLLTGRLPLPQEFPVTLGQDPPVAGPKTEATLESGEAQNLEGEPQLDVPIVGIGASAGGLSALEAFFSGMPPDRDPGMAFVLVQHLAPDHKSILSELISRQTRMKVVQVEDGMQVEPNCVYIIPPNRDMALSEGRLHLTKPELPRGHRFPIDFFFRSLAKKRGDRAICVLLSGTGSDGTLGLRTIKGEGGMAMVQEPETTEYPGMPQSAISTGLVDFVLPPGEMPGKLMEYAQAALEGVALSDGSRTPQPEPPAGSRDVLDMLFVLIRDRTGHDFSGYKGSTIHRRLQRRMAVQQVARLEDYVRFLKASPEETEALFRDLLIGVTRFFRDPEAFRALADTISDLIANKAPGSAVRVWVPGCSTGEEAYSIAILLRDKMEEMEKSLRVQIFATDIDSRAIEIARSAVYPNSVAQDLPDGVLTRFFILEENEEPAYRIRKDVRKMLIFSEQNVLQDPPFSRLDLISCRNLMIYLSPALQKQLVPLFHYALNPEGVLFLGTAESIGDSTDLFLPLERRMGLYRRQEVPHAPPRRLRGLTARPGRKRSRTRESTPGAPDGAPIHHRRLTETALLEETGSVAALVDEGGEILYLYGRTGLYLEPAPGDGVMNVLRMAREGLRRTLAIDFRRATSQQERVRREGVEVKTNGDSVRVDLVVRPVSDGLPASEGSTGEPSSPLFLVILKPVPSPAPDKEAQAAPGEEKTTDPGLTRRIAELERELEAKEEYLRATQEEMQSTHEELRTSIEELQSTNEELQSTNEELETSQEELQSLNEELSTVNTELESKVADLSRAHDDMQNLLSGTGIATVFLDQQLRIQRFTPTTTRLMNLIGADVGRPVGDMATTLVSYDSLAADAARVLETLETRKLEVQARDGQWYLLSIRPYRTLENVIQGAVLTFTDITELKSAQAAAREAEDLRQLAVVVRDSNDPVVSLDLEGRIRAWNPAAERVYGWNEEDALQMSYLDIVPEGLRAEMRSILEATAGNAQELAPLQTERLTREGETVTIWFTASVLVDESGQPYAISTTERPTSPAAPEGG